MFSLFVVLEFLSENSLIVTLLCIGLFFYISRRYGIVFMKTELYEENNYCSDENCVRCNKYNVTVVNALKKISSVKDRVISFKIQKGINFIHRPLDAGFKQRPNVFYYDNLTARNIWDKKFDCCSTLENDSKIILSEVEYLTENNHLGVWKKNRTPNGSWDVFHLINQGSAVPENQALCPQTMNIINSLSTSMKKNVFGNVMFSVLRPGTEITPHYGPTNIRLRCHLGIKFFSKLFICREEYDTLDKPMLIKEVTWT